MNRPASRSSYGGTCFGGALTKQTTTRVNRRSTTSRYGGPARPNRFRPRRHAAGTGARRFELAIVPAPTPRHDPRLRLLHCRHGLAAAAVRAVLLAQPTANQGFDTLHVGAGEATSELPARGRSSRRAPRAAVRVLRVARGSPPSRAPLPTRSPLLRSRADAGTPCTRRRRSTRASP